MKRVEDVGRLEAERKAMFEKFEDIANLLDMPGFRLPEFRAESLDQLFEHVSRLRSNLDDAKEDRAELERQLEQARDSNFNEAYAGRMMSDSDQMNLKRAL